MSNLECFQKTFDQFKRIELDVRVLAFFVSHFFNVNTKEIENSYLEFINLFDFICLNRNKNTIKVFEIKELTFSTFSSFKILPESATGTLVDSPYFSIS
jgi:hypothetical protein